MKKFINNIAKYYKYAVYSAKAELKSEVADSYLNWLWWIIEPFCFMLIYTFNHLTFLLHFNYIKQTNVCQHISAFNTLSL